MIRPALATLLSQYIFFQWVVGQGGFLRGRLRGLREKGPWALFREGPRNFRARKAISI